MEEALQSDLAEQAALSNEEADLPRKRRRTRSSMEGTKDNNSENGASPQLRAVGATSSKRGKGSRSRSKPGASPQLAPTAYVDDDEGPTSPNPSGGRSRTSSRRASKTRQADPDGTGLEDFAMEQPQSPSLGGRRKKKQEQPAPNPTEDGHEDGAAKSPAGSTRSKKKEAAGSSSAEKQKGKSSPVGNDQGSSSASSPAPGAGGQVPGTLPGAGAASLASFFGLTGVRSVPGAPGGSSSATSGRFASLLAQLRSKDDPTAQMIALQELSEILSVATEDMFSSRLGGYGGSSMSGFDVEAWVRELLNVVKGGFLADAGLVLAIQLFR